MDTVVPVWFIITFVSLWALPFIAWVVVGARCAWKWISFKFNRR